MKLILKTTVNQPPEQVWQQFDRELFLQLAPPFPRVKLLQFDGCRLGDMVKLELDLVLFRQVWSSLITEHGETRPEIYFVDEGQQLPFFLRYWRHRHRLIRLPQGTEIIDDIEYRSPFPWMDYLLYPSMWLQFAYRQPIYRKRFA